MKEFLHQNFEVNSLTNKNKNVYKSDGDAQRHAICKLLSSRFQVLYNAFIMRSTTKYFFFTSEAAN